MKTVVGLTSANERAVKNWFQAKNGPSGEFLIALCRHSDHALETVLLMSGREEQVKRRSSLTRRRNFGRCDADGRTAGQIDPGRVRAYVANRSPAFSNSRSLTRL